MYIVEKNKQFVEIKVQKKLSKSARRWNNVTNVGAILTIITLIGLFFAGVGIFIWYETTPKTIIRYYVYLIIVFIIWGAYCVTQLS